MFSLPIRLIDENEPFANRFTYLRKPHPMNGKTARELLILHSALMASGNLVYNTASLAQAPEVVKILESIKIPYTTYPEEGKSLRLVISRICSKDLYN